MLVAGDDDFTNFLQLGLGYPGFDETQADHNGFDTPMGDLGMDQLAMDSSVGNMRGHTLQNGASTSEQERSHLIHAYSQLSNGTDSVLNAPTNQHQHGQQERERNAQKSPYNSRIMVPPTPQSSEMQGGALRYYHYMEGDALSEFDPYQRRRDDQVGAENPYEWCGS